MVFKVESKIQMYDRAVDTFGELRSEINPDLLGFRFEVSHLNHIKDENYNNPENGLVVTSLDHYVHHLLHLNNPLDIGLFKSQNNFAINKCYQRTCEDAKALGWDNLQLTREIRKSRSLWVARLNLKYKEA